jgi:hypothetical protein
MGMNQWSSHRNDENRKDIIIFTRAPRSGPLRSTAGLFVCFSEIAVVDPLRGRPVGGGS